MAVVVGASVLGSAVALRHLESRMEVGISKVARQGARAGVRVSGLEMRSERR